MSISYYYFFWGYIPLTVAARNVCKRPSKHLLLRRGFVLEARNFRVGPLHSLVIARASLIRLLTGELWRKPRETFESTIVAIVECGVDYE